MVDSVDALPASDKELDTSGLFCPEPIMMMHNAVRDMTTGEVLKVIATDPATTRDVPKFCQFLGHDLQQHHTLEDGTHWYFIRLG
ncbi:sulfurtransferase TusA [Halomonas denitrificans]|uniref:sulfurtransferase TusA n=1 Tax=Halomonas TaxID=2745 RepID=UPI001A8F8797|nr:MULTISPECIES: sulfurtransferase TusA [Halomonas]MED5294933.1 sulfurtransferase TusA [Pseudomonadota bacterium]MBN8414230.1 sulfurtransferase TusA [Halomonas litopenaei]MBY5930925.1 sulfurtransferase TusA [Halomonas sp. DP8Y7-3]MBY5970330.1 sulfurtransferase TusA [Halomonas denitrificans]MBY5985986.1 sulfurtransferase TusA [Halomonas sp. DP5Y7-2]